MLNDQFLAALARDGTAFLDSCLAAPADAVIAACPEWNPADLLWHLGGVQSFWGGVVEQRATSWDQVPSLERLADAELADWYRTGLARLLGLLSSIDPATEVWTWSDQHDVAFIIRRMAQETAMHRWDADVAAGRPTAIEAELASNGIDEFLELMLARSSFLDASLEATSVGGSVHLHCTDVAGEWTVRPTPGGLVTTREHAKGDCALRGPADVLLRALWRRATTLEVEVIGDAAVAARFLAYARLD